MKVKRDELSLRGQSTLEYVVLIILIVLALLASQVYIKRAIQGRWKQAMDNVGEQYDYNSTHGTSVLCVESNTVSNVTLVGPSVPGGSGWLKRNEQVNTIENRQSTEFILGY